MDTIKVVKQFIDAFIFFSYYVIIKLVYKA